MSVSIQLNQNKTFISFIHTVTVTLLDDITRSKITAFLSLLILVLTLLSSGCSQFRENGFTENNSVNLFNSPDNSSLPTRHEVMNKLSRISENPKNLSIGSLFEIDELKGYNIVNLTKRLQP